MPLLSTFGAASARGFGNLSGIAIPVDNLFNTVSFLSHFDGTNNGVNNVFDDSSSSNHTITANGDVTQGSFGPFARPDGEWSVAFDGTGDYVHTAQSAYSNTGSFTAEAWVYTTVTDTVNERRQHIITQQKDNDASRSNFALEIVFATQIVFRVFSAAGDKFVVVTSNSGLEPNTWTHIAGSFDGSNLRLFVNGVLKGTTASTNAPRNTTQPVAVGARTTNDAGTTATEFFQGYISNARLTKSAVYTSAFTPTTAPLTAITNTQLLTCQSNRFVDNSTSAHTITASGDATVSAFGPFLTSKVYSAGVNGASAYFDGTGDYLSCGSSNDFNMSDGDITWDAWVYATAENSQGGNQKIICEYYSNSTNFMQIAFMGSTDIRMFLRVNNVDLNLTASNSVNLNQWHHIAVTRTSGGDWSLYIDGDRKATGSEAAAFNTSAIPFIVGLGQLSPGSRYFIGYIQDVRIVKGSLVYTGTTYTVPTAPLTAVTNTKLLLNMADGQAIDSAAQNTLTLFGNAKISNTQSKFGGTSLALDGTGDYATLPPNSLDLGAGNFTLESWVYTTVTGKQNIIGATRNSDGVGSYMININRNSNQVRFFCRYNGGTVLDYNVGSGNFPTNAWTHLAITRDGANLRVFIDGTQVGTTNTTLGSFAIDNASLNGGIYYIGRTTDGASDFTGFLDDLRVSKTARYTSNFTPPTAAFENKGQ